ncbi:hypothetical protein [Legionella drancourtii]|nr:hypothetical protein [Legionella drancourtii]
MEDGQKRKIRRIIFKVPEKKDKWMICIRFPSDIRSQLKEQSEKDYEGRGKQSILIEEAIKYYLYTCSEIKWADYQKDLDYAELIDDINEGLNQRDLGNATQVFISHETKIRLLELEKKIKLTAPLMKDVRTGLIRKAVSIRLSLGGKEFFESVMSIGQDIN